MRALTLTTDGMVAFSDFADVEQLESFVDGSLEYLPLDGSTVLVFNDDGLMRGLPHNAVATALVLGLGAGYSDDDVIAGNAVVLSWDDGSVSDVNPAVTATLQRLGLPTPDRASR